MQDYIDSLYKNNVDKIANIKKKYSDFFTPLFEACNYSDTTGQGDCLFLSLLIINYKPKNILEIGTWVGTTSYTMASSSNDCNVYTCDNNDRFVNLNIEVNKRIFTHPKTHSTDFLKKVLNENKKFEMFFNDASLSNQDCELICDLASNNFIFATHDYYSSTGSFEKGYFAIESMKNILNQKNIKYVEYVPKKEWYFEDKINNCSALLICEKTN